MRTYYRTSPRTAVSFGCVGTTLIGFVFIGLLALGGALALGAVALALGAFVGWFALWVMPASLYRAFAKEFRSTGVGVGAVLVWFGFCAGVAAVTLWIL